MVPLLTAGQMPLPALPANQPGSAKVNKAALGPRMCDRPDRGPLVLLGRRRPRRRRFSLGGKPHRPAVLPDKVEARRSSPGSMRPPRIARPCAARARGFLPWSAGSGRPAGLVGRRIGLTAAGRTATITIAISSAACWRAAIPKGIVMLAGWTPGESDLDAYISRRLERPLAWAGNAGRGRGACARLHLQGRLRPDANPVPDADRGIDLRGEGVGRKLIKRPRGLGADGSGVLGIHPPPDT